MNYEGKNVLITGISSTIGEELAFFFAERKSNLIIT